MLQVISAALAELGASFEDVARTRMYLTDITRWGGRASRAADPLSVSDGGTTAIPALILGTIVHL